MKVAPENFSSLVFADIQQIVDQENDRAEEFVGQMADSARRRVIDKSPEHATPYPITVYGTRIKDSAGTADYVDERGNKLDCFMVISAPEDEGYDTFDATVPVPKAPTA